MIYVKYGFEAELDSFIQDKILVKALSQVIEPNPRKNRKKKEAKKENEKKVLRIFSE